MSTKNEQKGLLMWIIEASLRQRLLVALVTLFIVGWGLYVAPFSWTTSFIERDPVPVDAIPDLSENQQIVFTEWPGRSPQDIEDQITYPLTAELLGIPRVKTIRSSSMFGFSSIYVIFEEDADYYWTRARVNEKLSSLSAGMLPDGVQPRMGPDATALGQIFWYTLEGQDGEGNPTGGWDDDELRALQDFTIRQALSSAEGVAEVASIGGKVREYHVEVDPDRMRAFGVSLDEVMSAVAGSNAEVGARTMEINGVDYLIRGLGFVKNVEDIEQAVIKTVDSAPVLVKDVARVELGPGLRRGALTKGGAEVVGGVVTARYGANPREVIDNVKEAIEVVQVGLPERVLDDGTVSKVTIVPFYDRTELIERTLGTLSSALIQQILITILVICLLMLHLRASILVSSILPLAVLITFIAMKYTGVDANVVALAGIAIAIGTVIDLGIVITENISEHIDRDELGGGTRLERVARGAKEVAPAVMTAIVTTIIGFLPVFMLTGQEGRLFTPLAYTKTYALIAAFFVAVVIIPVAATVLLGNWVDRRWARISGGVLFSVASLVTIFMGYPAIGVAALIGTLCWIGDGLVQSKGEEIRRSAELRWFLNSLGVGVLSLVVGWYLTLSWMPLGAGVGRVRNFIFVVGLVGGLLAFFWLFRVCYPYILRRLLKRKLLFLSLPAMVTVLGVTIWMGFGEVFGWLPRPVHRTAVAQWFHEKMPGLDREFMPNLDEGTFLYMPSTMPHASFGQALEMVQQLDLLLETIPEVEYSVGKIGRAESALDPAPVGMVETVIEYLPEYRLNEQGRQIYYAVDANGEFKRDSDGELIPDARGLPYRNWRDEIKRAEDIWDEIISVASEIPGLTSAPLLQPISTRIVMLQSGIQAPMAVRLKGPDLEELGEAALQIQALLREHPMVSSGAVNADRPVGQPYLEILPERRQLARYGISMESFQRTVEAAIGGAEVTQTLEGRERFAVRVSYPRELRDSPEAVEQVLLTSSEGAQIPLGEVAEVRFTRGPDMIQSENSSLVAYVMFAGAEGFGEVDVVNAAREAIEQGIERGDIILGEGVHFDFAGNFENSLRAEKRLQVLIPLILLIILGLIYMQFRSLWTSLSIFSGIAVAFGGGFLLIWLYGQPGFLDFSILGASMREIFQVGPVNLSIAVWVGFIALFGIAADDGIVMATYLQQRFGERQAGSVEEVREMVVDAGLRRIRPCLMTTATTVLALFPILTSQGTGADVMIPMAIPAVGGMMVAQLTLFVVPIAYAMQEEFKLWLKSKVQAGPES